MRSSKLKWLLILSVGILAGVLLFWNRSVVDPPRPFTIGLVTWIGYGPVFIADEKGLFRQHGLDLRVKVMDGPGERESAYLAGDLDFFPNTPDAFVILYSTQSPRGKLVLALDESSGADGVVARSTIGSIAELRGRSVGFQSGITSHFLLLYLLNQAGLSGRDIRQENLAAGEAGAAFMAGKLDAAVTWEPWLTNARKSPNSHVLATTKDTNGLVVDVILASERALENDARALHAFTKAWYDAVRFITEHPDEARTIMSKHLKMPAEEVEQMLQTTRFYNFTEHRRYMQERLPQIVQTASQLFVENKVIQRQPDLKQAIDPFVAQQ